MLSNYCTWAAAILAIIYLHRFTHTHTQAHLHTHMYTYMYMHMYTHTYYKASPHCTLMVSPTFGTGSMHPHYTWLHPNWFHLKSSEGYISSGSDLFNIPVVLFLMCFIRSLSTNNSVPLLSSTRANTISRFYTGYTQTK